MLSILPLEGLEVGGHKKNLDICNKEFLIEIQIRTELQDLWALLSEKLSDTIDPAVKYGGGNKEVLSNLKNLSSIISRHEELEEDLCNVKILGLSTGTVSLESEIDLQRKELVQGFREVIETVEKQIEKRQ